MWGCTGRQALVCNSNRVLGVLALGAGLMAITPTAVLAQPIGVTGYEAVWLEALGGSELDDFGRALGSTAGDPHALPAVWINGRVFALPVPDGYKWASGDAISPTTGFVVGGTSTPWDPIAWRAGKPFILANLGGGECSANGVNDSGWAVGNCNGPNRAPLWIKGGDPIDLGARLPGCTFRSYPCAGTDF